MKRHNRPVEGCARTVEADVGTRFLQSILSLLAQSDMEKFLLDGTPFLRHQHQDSVDRCHLESCGEAQEAQRTSSLPHGNSGSYWVQRLRQTCTRWGTRQGNCTARTIRRLPLLAIRVTGRDHRSSQQRSSTSGPNKESRNLIAKESQEGDEHQDAKDVAAKVTKRADSISPPGSRWGEVQSQTTNWLNMWTRVQPSTSAEASPRSRVPTCCTPRCIAPPYSPRFQGFGRVSVSSPNVSVLIQGNQEFCENNAKRVKEYARRFPRGHWSFLGPDSEKNWYATCNGKPNGCWDRTAEKMMHNFERFGHPIFRCTSALVRGQ